MYGYNMHIILIVIDGASESIKVMFNVGLVYRLPGLLIFAVNAFILKKLRFYTY